jgi:hypothetical protein
MHPGDRGLLSAQEARTRFAAISARAVCYRYERETLYKCVASYTHELNDDEGRQNKTGSAKNSQSA